MSWLTDVPRWDIGWFADWNQEAWTGADEPPACFGEWHLYHDGNEVYCPFGKRNAGTYGRWQCWDIDWDTGERVAVSYPSGRKMDDWVQDNKEWLAMVAEEEEWPRIYAAFHRYDWRCEDCGRCGEVREVEQAQ